MSTVSFKYWNECVDRRDLEEMWSNLHVATEWLNAGETTDSNVHLSRDPEGQIFLTQTEMAVVAGIVVARHFASQIDPVMVCAIAQLESGRQPLAIKYNEKTKLTTTGLMQISQKTAEWLVNDLGYRTYDVTGDSTSLYRPFINVYLGAAYLLWLSKFEQKERSEEFIVRAFKGGTKKATHKSTLQYWKRYISSKESYPTRVFEVGPLQPAPSPTGGAVSGNKGCGSTTWDSRTCAEDMEAMWNNREVSKEWTKSGEKRGKVRFSHDTEKRPYLSRVEMRAVAKIILSRHFSSKGVKPNALAALAETISMRFVDGVGERSGLMGIDYPTSCWLYKDLGYKAYTVGSVEDLKKPFVSMYFGAAYLSWLSQYQGKDRTPQFVAEAYLVGPENVNDNQQETSPLMKKFEEALSQYQELKRESGSCSFL